jgi:hypothetical protein
MPLKATASKYRRRITEKPDDMRIREIICKPALSEQAEDPLARLAHHKAIGWDFDLTLIDSPASPVLQDFIKDHPEIRHVIVTFRSHGMQNTIFKELARQKAAPPQSMFNGILNIENRAYEEFQHDQTRRLTGVLSGPPTEHELYYWNWKGLTCKQHGLTALVDDKADHTEDGCRDTGVTFFNTAWFVPRLHT